MSDDKIEKPKATLIKQPKKEVEKTEPVEVTEQKKKKVVVVKKKVVVAKKETPAPEPQAKKETPQPQNQPHTPPHNQTSGQSQNPRQGNNFRGENRPRGEWTGQPGGYRPRNERTDKSEK